MNKNTKKLHSGFTIAELLLSMLVVMVVAASMVPIIGPKKVKIPNVKRSHGIFECYYDKDGNLMQYQANNQGLKDAVPKKVEGGADHCEFRVPAADRYEIYAIGAGSEGYLNPEGLGYKIVDGDGTLGGNLDVTDFSSSISNIKADASYSFGIPEGSFMQTEVRKLFGEWSDYLVGKDSGLYVAVSNMKSPVGAGGRGLANRVWLNETKTINCTEFCPDRPGCTGPYKKPGGGYFMVGFSLDANEGAKENDMCYYYLHAMGGRSAMGSAQKDGTIFLFPVDGSNSSQFFVNNADDYLQVQTMLKNGKTAQILLEDAEPGKDASLSDTGLSYGGELGYGSDKAKVTVKNTYGIAKVIDGSITSLPSSMYPALNPYFTYPDTRRNEGTSHGSESGSGAYYSDSAVKKKPGEIIYTPNAFSWEYSGLKVKYNYGDAGTPGDVNVMTYNSLHGILYLYPGKNNGTVSAYDTVVSKVPLADRGPSRDKKGDIVTAKSYKDPGEPGSFTSVLIPDEMPMPDKNVIKRATPQNQKFNQYISRMRNSGFNNGLYHCFDTDHSCPGFAGSGAYPYVYIADTTTRLTLKDNQTLYKNSLGKDADGKEITTGMYQKKYTVHKHEYEIDPCEYDKGLKTYGKYTWEGKEYPSQYCIPSPDKRRDGAVVIIW